MWGGAKTELQEGARQALTHHSFRFCPEAISTVLEMAFFSC